MPQKGTKNTKTIKMYSSFCFLLCFLCLFVATARAQNITELQRGFERPPDDARIMMRWWWFGPSVTKSELEREMRLMKAGGIGGFEVQPVYPLLPDDPTRGIRNLPFLSDEFIEALRFVSSKSRELGLRMDLTLGSGWPFGGPSVPISDAAGTLRSERVKVQPNSRRISVPSITAGERLLAVFLTRIVQQTVADFRQAQGSPQTSQSALRFDSLRELTDIHDGAVWLPNNLEGSHEVLFFISSRTGMQVKRPAVGA